MRNKLIGLVLSSLVLSAASTAYTGEKPRPIQGRVSPKPPPKEQPEPSPTEPFDLSKLDPVDPATTRAIAVFAERCKTSEFSREGPSADEVAKCNAAAASVGAQGKKGTSAILAALNDKNGKLGSFGRRRLYGVLAKIDDEPTRDVLVAGLAKIASEKLEAHTSYVGEIERTLRAMAGAGPAVAIPWEKPAVVRDWLVEVAEHAAAWRAFQTENKGKSRAQISQETLTAARVEKTSDDAKKAYRAIHSLSQHAPEEALGAVKAYRKRSDLPKAAAEAFQALESQINLQVERTAKPKPTA